jgi:transcriptional regulator with XRE-family HTH domain
MSRNDPRARDGNAIARRRIELCLTQQQLGDLIGASQRQISSWETRRYTPSSKSLAKLAKALSCSIEELMRE